MAPSFWRRPSHTVLMVSEDPSRPLYDTDFLRHPDLRVISTMPDDGAPDLVVRELPDLIIEVLDLPGSAGLAFLKELAHHPLTRGIPVIVVAEDRPEDIRDDRPITVLRKPIDRSEFFDAVRRFIPMPQRRARRVRINLRFTFRHGDRTVQAFSRDLSPDGVFLKTDRVLELGTIVDLAFRVPGELEEIRCRGIVRCTATRWHGEPGGIGFEFIELSETARERLETFLGLQVRRPSLLSR